MISRKQLRQHLELLLNSGIKEIEKSGVDRKEKLQELAIQYAQCSKCDLSQGRTNLVYGEGNPFAKVMIIGEAPGQQEDLKGRPFIGRAGELLTKMLAAIQIQRDEVYITNIAKCRPPANREPTIAERAACLPYLIEQIQIIQPQMFLFLGLVSAQFLLNTNASLGELRKEVQTFMDRPAYVIYHPAALLRNEHLKRPAWEDLQRFQKHYLSLNT